VNIVRAAASVTINAILPGLLLNWSIIANALIEEPQ
jgi:hypothetical protein